MPKYDIDPVGRIEGHLGVEFYSAVVPGNPASGGPQPVTQGLTKCEGTMYRGFENIMLDRQPQEGIQITQRI